MMPTTRSRWTSRACTVAGLLMLAASPAAGQTVTGTLFGRVVDAGDLPLPGASATIRSAQLIGGAQTRITDENGDYRFPALPPGTYNLTVEMPGFATHSREGVILGAGASIGIDVKLALAGVQETVTVTGESPMVDAKSSQMRQTASKDLIENIPTARSFIGVFDLMPGVVNINYSVATTGASSVYGGSGRNNMFSLDGANLNDPLVAYAGADVNLETISEIQVTTAGMSAEFGGASGGVFNVITKSGSNNLLGQISGYFQDDALQSGNLTDELRAQGVQAGTRLAKASDWGGSLGGPVMRDRLWYFMNYQQIDQRQEVINFPPGVNTDQYLYFGKATTQLTRHDRLDALYQYRLKYVYVFQPSVLEQNPTGWVRQRQNNHTTNVKWTRPLTDRTFLEGRWSVGNQRRHSAYANATDNTYGYRDQSTGQRWGWWAALAQPGNRNSRQLKFDLTHFATGWGPGSHDVKAGWTYEWLINDEFRDWRAGARVHLLFDGRADRIELGNAPVTQNSNVNQYAFYLQDQWSPAARLTLNLGVRGEVIEGWWPKGSTGGVNFPRREFPEERDVVDFKNIAPRLGITYDLFGNRRTVAKATWGRYYNQIYVGEFTASRPFSAGSQVYRWVDTNGDLIWQEGEQRELISDSTVAGLGRIDPDVRQSYVENATLGIDHQITGDLAVGAMVILKNEHHLAEIVDAARPFDSAYVPITLPNPLSRDPITVYALDPAFRGIPTQRLYTNPGGEFCSFCPDLTRRYRGVQFTVARRLKDRWQLFGSYLFSHNDGTKGTGHSESQANVFGNPNSLVNAFGRLTFDRPHQIKIQGTYQLPRDVLVSATYTGLSGLPWARQIRFLRSDSPLLRVETSITVKGEPSGGQRLPFLNVVNLRVEKKLNWRGVGMGLIADLFNVFNVSTVTGLQQTRIDHPDFAKPGEIALARALRIGARVDF